MAELRDIGLGFARGIGGGALLGGQAIRRRVGEDITQERKLPLRKIAAAELGIAPEPPGKLVSDIETFNKKNALQDFLATKTAELQTDVKRRVVPTAPKIQDKQKQNIINTLVKNIEAQRVNIEFDKDPERNKKAIDKAITNIKQGNITEAKGILEATPYSGTSLLKGFSKSIKSIDTGVSPIAKLTEVLRALTPEQKKKFTAEFNERRREVVEEYRTFLHEQLPYYEDMASMLQLQRRATATGRATAKKNVFTGVLINKSADGYSRLVADNIPQLNEDEKNALTRKGITSESIDRQSQIAGNLNARINDLRKDAKTVVPDNEAYPALELTGGIVNLVTPLIQQSRGQISNGTVAARIGENEEMRKYLLGVVKSKKNLIEQPTKRRVLAGKFSDIALNDIKNKMINERPDLRESIEAEFAANREEDRSILISSYDDYLFSMQVKDNYEGFWNSIVSKKYELDPIQAEIEFQERKSQVSKEEEIRREGRISVLEKLPRPSIPGRGPLD